MTIDRAALRTQALHSAAVRVSDSEWCPFYLRMSPSEVIALLDSMEDAEDAAELARLERDEARDEIDRLRPKPERVMAIPESIIPVDPQDRKPAEVQCAHGVVFDGVLSRGLSAAEVQRRWPRLYGDCPLGCGFSGIGYASYAHYISGDW